jgi:hypothetical protein
MKKPPTITIPSGRNYLEYILSGLISSFKKGRKVATVDVVNIHARADSMDRQNVVLIRSEEDPDAQ